MKKLTYLLLLAGLCLLAACQNQQAVENAETSLETLESEIAQLFAGVDGEFALAFQMPGDTSTRLLVNAKESFHAASTMKTPVMIEVFKQAESGGLSLNDSILLKNEFYSIVDSSTYSMEVSRDSEGELYTALGQQWPVRDLVIRMITRSSNLATNLLIEHADARKVTQTMRELGAPDIQVLRGVEDMKAFEQGLSNSTTAFDLMMIYTALGNNQVASPEATREMLDILLSQEYNDIIPGKLPEEVQVAHKTGWITGVRHDSGLVMLPDGRQYALVILSKEVTDMDATVEMMATASRKVYDFVMNLPAGQ